MSPEKRDDFTERWLDDALAHYSDSEPRAGFEGRILSGLAEQKVERAPAWRRFAWIPAACAAMILLAAGLFAPRPPGSPPVVATKGPAPVQQSAMSVAGGPKPPVIARRLGVRTKTTDIAEAPHPRQGKFPASVPPTEQDLLLVAYLNATPVHELLAVAADQKAWRERVRAEPGRESPKPDLEPDVVQVSPPEGGSADAGSIGTR